MGKIAEMMTTGILCAICGAALDCEECQEMEIPMYCSDECAKDAGIKGSWGWKARVCNHLNKNKQAVA